MYVQVCVLIKDITRPPPPQTRAITKEKENWNKIRIDGGRKEEENRNKERKKERRK